VNEYCFGCPVILVGLKSDLRDRSLQETGLIDGEKLIRTDQAASVAADIGARKYVECSALTGHNVDRVFEIATRAALLGKLGNKKVVKKSSSCLLC
jgi:Rho family protein